MFDFIEKHSNLIILTGVVLSLFSFLLVCFNIIRTNKVMRKYKRLMRGADNKNLEAMLYQQLETLQAGVTHIKELELAHLALNNQLNRCLQKIGMVRYNAFDHMGSDQSFSIALLDTNGDGFVLTSLYGRNTSTSFAKPIKGRQSSYPLSEEEKQAMNQAMK